MPGVQDDATFEMVKNEGWDTYKDYYGQHRKNTFSVAGSARKAHLAANMDKGFLRRHVGAEARGLAAGGGALLNNRARRVMSVGPVMATGARTMLSRSLHNQANLGFKSSYDASMGQHVASYNRFDGDYFHAGKPLDDDNMGRLGRGHGRGRRGGRPGGGGGRRHQRGS
ncbi:MAG: hypothetical protein FJX23_01750 [Alphaproteobacteria bacterium]|nr:hypothetical protein [Alphaproteobacteria bacterium]